MPQNCTTWKLTGIPKTNCWDSSLIFDVTSQRMDDKKIVWSHNAAVQPAAPQDKCQPRSFPRHVAAQPQAGLSPMGCMCFSQNNSVIHWELSNGPPPMLSLMSHPLFERGQTRLAESLSGSGTSGSVFRPAFPRDYVNTVWQKIRQVQRVGTFRRLVRMDLG